VLGNGIFNTWRRGRAAPPTIEKPREDDNA
jgi:hypothetical protein